VVTAVGLAEDSTDGDTDGLTLGLDGAIVEPYDGFDGAIDDLNDGLLECTNVGDNDGVAVGGITTM